jgi:tetratricopeptide (TPR) repeat protein/GTP-binding protein EngB required for normal cell division
MSLWSRIERRLGDIAGELLLDDYRDQILQARALIAAGDAAAAADTMEALVRERPDHGQAWIVLGAARLELREPELAIVAFDRARKLRAGDPEALVGHGEAALALGRLDEAIASYERAVDEAAGERGVLAEAYRGLGLAWRRKGDIDKAIRELRKAAAETPGDATVRAALGEALLADERAATDEARRHLERAADSADAPAIAFLALGRLALADDLPATAAGHFTRARDLAAAADSPASKVELLDALLGLGDAALAERDATGAHHLYLQALQLDPRRGDVHARIAAAHRAIGNHDAALASLERAVALGAGPAALRAALDTAVASGDVARAVRFANDVLAADPTDPRALVARALGMLDAGQLDAARAMLGLALAGRDEASARVVTARIELAADPSRAGGRRAAEAALGALRVAPADPAARAMLATARARELGIDAPPADPGDIRSICDDLSAALATRPDLAPLVGDVARAAADLDTPLLVTVMGEFSSGKSSFVNAFIGHDVAPTGITPTTATINVVRYGREKGGRIVCRDGTAELLGWDPLFARLRALTDAEARDVDRVEILLPLPHLEAINIVDTPGLNSILPEHEATARAFIARSDAVVWVFTASQGGKASERKALRTIRDEGRRILGVLNKRDQLSPTDEAELVTYLGKELDGLVEVIVPFSARRALAWKQAAAEATDDGNWGALIGALEQRFFDQARQLKRAACARRLTAVVDGARAVLSGAAGTTHDAAERLRRAAGDVDGRALAFIDDVVARERRALVEAATALYRRAAREVLDLVRPRRLPFGTHSATVADRDYLIALLDDGFATALDASRARVLGELRQVSAAAAASAGEAGGALGADVRGDLARLGEDRVEIVAAEVFARARAYLRGYLEGGWVEAFFRNELPRLELAEDPTYHALVKSAPDLEREVALPLARAGVSSLDAIARRVEHWAAVADAAGYDLDVGLGRALDAITARLGA